MLLIRPWGLALERILRGMDGGCFLALEQVEHGGSMPIPCTCPVSTMYSTASHSWSSRRSFPAFSIWGCAVSTAKVFHLNLPNCSCREPSLSLPENKCMKAGACLAVVDGPSGAVEVIPPEGSTGWPVIEWAVVSDTEGEGREEGVGKLGVTACVVVFHSSEASFPLPPFPPLSPLLPFFLSPFPLSPF